MTFGWLDGSKEEMMKVVLTRPSVARMELISEAIRSPAWGMSISFTQSLVPASMRTMLGRQGRELGAASLTLSIVLPGFASTF